MNPLPVFCDNDQLRGYFFKHTGVRCRRTDQEQADRQQNGSFYESVVPEGGGRAVR